VIGAGALVVGGVAALLVLVTSGARPVASSKVAGPLPDASTAARMPELQPVALELIALGHEREDNRITVRGVVRNAGNTTVATHLTAVVLLFNSEGGFLTSGRAAVGTAGLAPGTEVPFVITIPGAADVGRYRVSFRSDDRVMPHVDRRKS
jgi:hypothetical protein